ncbi:hypothetical protein C0Q70_15706 [Pomacea canaliculata]|uniref:Uncharacterized protein n=1 Tax=Pomacea canaliculata TaxID=400727 RepID=A0A2T7NVK6_POMCA|nr:hypothetical protein C0Q70_15706 [Pomacea canaliculata]
MSSPFFYQITEVELILVLLLLVVLRLIPQFRLALCHMSYVTKTVSAVSSLTLTGTPSHRSPDTKSPILSNFNTTTTSFHWRRSSGVVVVLPVVGDMVFTFVGQPVSRQDLQSNTQHTDRMEQLQAGHGGCRYLSLCPRLDVTKTVSALSSLVRALSFTLTLTGTPSDRSPDTKPEWSLILSDSNTTNTSLHWRRTAGVVALPVVVSMVVVVPETSSVGNRHQSVDNRHQSVDNRHQSVDNRHQSVDNRHQSVDNRHQSVDNRHQSVDNRHQSVDNRHQSVDNRHQCVDNRHQSVDNRHQITQPLTCRTRNTLQAPYAICRMNGMKWCSCDIMLIILFSRNKLPSNISLTTNYTFLVADFNFLATDDRSSLQMTDTAVCD